MTSSDKFRWDEGVGVYRLNRSKKARRRSLQLRYLRISASWRLDFYHHMYSCTTLHPSFHIQVRWVPVTSVLLFLFWTPRVVRNPRISLLTWQFRLGNNVSPLMIDHQQSTISFHGVSFRQMQQNSLYPRMCGEWLWKKIWGRLTDRRIWPMCWRAMGTGLRYRDLCKKVRPSWTIKGMRDTTASSYHHEGHLLGISFGSLRSCPAKSSPKTSSRHYIHKQSQLWSF